MELTFVIFPLMMSQKKLSKALDFQNRTKGREQIKHLEIKLVAERLTSIYDMVIKRTSVIK